MSDWKEFSSELARKAVEQVSIVSYKYDHKEITREQAIVAADIIYDLTSGLVPWDVTDLAYNLRRELKNEQESCV